MSKLIERQIERIYRDIFKKVFTKERLERAEKGDKTVINKALKGLSTSDLYKEFCNKFAKKLAQRGLSKEKGLWRKYYEAAKQKHMFGLPSTYTAFQKQVYEKIVKQNFTMIKSIPDSMMKVWKQKDVTTLLRQVLEGKVGRGTFEVQLRQHGAKNAKLIARTETAKLQAAITETRSREVGSVAYIWRSSNDRRTRPSHKAMNDVVVFWRPLDEQPLLDNMRGNAGCFPNCRCQALPILDEDDLTKNNYKVYDYRTNKLIKMSKKDLLKALEKNGL